MHGSHTNAMLDCRQLLQPVLGDLILFCSLKPPGILLRHHTPSQQSFECIPLVLMFYIYCPSNTRNTNTYSFTQTQTYGRFVVCFYTVVVYRVGLYMQTDRRIGVNAALDYCTCASKRCRSLRSVSQSCSRLIC